MDDIRYLKHSEINKEMWDACVVNSTNGLIYARSWYLDAMSPGWEALVHKDYIAVMPLTVSKKWGIKYLAQPAFSQQLGIIGPLDFGEAEVNSFIDILKTKFSLIEISLNFKNLYAGCEKKKNFVLDLGYPFKEIQSRFRKDLITKAIQAKLDVQESTNYMEVLDTFRNLYSEKLPHLKKKHFNNLSKVCEHLTETSNLIIKRIITKNGSLLANALFFRDEKRIYYIMSATLPEGRKLAANAFLIHEVIKEFSDSKYIFDFEGSSIPSISFFFRKFHPIEENYPIIRILPPVLKKIKTLLR